MSIQRQLLSIWFGCSTVQQLFSYLCPTNQNQQSMTINNIRATYFSPTGGTAKVVETIANALSQRFGVPHFSTPYTLPHQRADWRPISDGELLVWGTPVYAGRIPNKTLDFIQKAMAGHNNPVVLVAVYGGRSYDDTLSEMHFTAVQAGLISIAAVAVPTRHVFSEKISKNAPDLDGLTPFCSAIDPSRSCPVEVPGDPAPTKYYTPLKADGTPALFLKAKPVIDSKLCTSCSSCVIHCPMGTARLVDNSSIIFDGVCIKCHACVRLCPTHAIHFDNPDLLSHIQMLEGHCGRQKLHIEYWV